MIPGKSTPPKNGFGTSVWPNDVDLEVGHQAQRADQPAEVPVRLGAVGAEVGVVWPPQPDRVDLDQAAHQHEHRGDGREQAQRAQRVPRPHGSADDVVLAASRPAELGVALDHDDRQVHGDQRREQGGDDEHVRDVEA